MAPYMGKVHSGMFLPCEVAPRSDVSYGSTPRAIHEQASRTDAGVGLRSLDLLLLDALQTTTTPPTLLGGNSEHAPSGHHLVRCVYSDVILRERLIHPQSLVTTLTANYRSHPSLLMLPSLLFYGGSLESCAPPVLTSSCLSWSLLSRGSAPSFSTTSKSPSDSHPTDGFPLLCLGVVGADTHLVDSPSFWNVAEIDAVCSAITSLLGEARTAQAAGSPSLLAALTAQDIGVIAPYRQQVLRMRRALR